MALTDVARRRLCGLVADQGFQRPLVPWPGGTPGVSSLPRVGRGPLGGGPEIVWQGPETVKPGCTLHLQFSEQKGVGRQLWEGSWA